MVWGFTRFVKAIHVQALPHPQGSSLGLQCAFYSGLLPAGLFPEPGLPSILNCWNPLCFDIPHSRFDAQLLPYNSWQQARTRGWSRGLQQKEGSKDVSLFHSCTFSCFLHALWSLRFITLRWEAAFIVLNGKRRIRKAGAPTQQVFRNTLFPPQLWPCRVLQLAISYTKKI